MFKVWYAAPRTGITFSVDMAYNDCISSGSSMSQPLPVSDFKWLPKDALSIAQIKSYKLDSEFGYIFKIHG